MAGGAFPIITVGDLAAARRFSEQLGSVQTYQHPPAGEPASVDAILASLRSGGAPLVAEPEAQPWGERVARTCDPDGDLAILGAPR